MSGVRVPGGYPLSHAQATTLAAIIDDPDLAPLAEAAPFDHMAARRWMKVPAALETSAEVVLGTTRDLTAFAPRLAAGMFSGTQRHDADGRAHAVLRKLTGVAAETMGDDIDTWNRVLPAMHHMLVAFPVLLAHAENATGSWPVSLYRWPVMTRAPRDVVMASLLQAAHNYTPQDPMEPDDAAALTQEWDLLGTAGMRLTEACLRGVRRLSPFKSSPVTAEVLQAFLETGDLPPTEVPVKLALLTPGEETVTFATHSAGPWWKLGYGGTHAEHTVQLPFAVHGTDARTRQFLAAVFAGRDIPATLRESLAREARVVVQVRDANFVRAIADKVVELVSFHNTTHVHALVKSILQDGPRALGPQAVINGQPLYAFLAQAPIMRVTSDNAALATFINNAFQGNEPHMQRLRVALTLLEVQKLHYFDNADIKEAATDLLKGAEVGTLYELVSETLLEADTTVPFYQNALWYANVLGAGLIDYVDNRYGREAAAKLALRSRGKRVTAETLHGPNADPEVVSAMNGAASASAWGAALGTVLQVGPMIPMSNPNAPVWQLMLGSAFGTVATSLSIPVDVVQQLLKKLRAHTALYDEGILRTPDDGTPAARFNRMLSDAIRDITSSIEGQSSVTAFTLAPSIALLWLLLYASPGARDILQPVIFGLGPGFENLLTLVMAKLVKNGFNAASADFETVAYAEGVAHARLDDPDDAAHVDSDDAARDDSDYANRYDAATLHRWAVNTVHFLATPLRWLPAYRAAAGIWPSAEMGERQPLLHNA